jgi:BirA family transcriptional regulator, biotin operon repressor / biotin---[acetyl-CoA-carboxylase] ligase
LSLLDEEQIRQHLGDDDLNGNINLNLVKSIDSTNIYLKNNITKAMIDICCAETQTKGRGRFNRTWYSPVAENIYFSGRWTLGLNIKKLSSLSLVVGLAIVQTLAAINIHEGIMIKWPNDILWGNKKLAGILIELSTNISGDISVIIGIGMNINSNSKISKSPIDRPWCSLLDITGCLFDRNLIIAKLISTLNEYILMFIETGFANFIPKWQQLDYLLNKNIVVNQLSETINGISGGVNEFGELILLDENRNTHFLNAGETSLRDLP